MMAKYCCFVWALGIILRSAVFWPKYRSNEEQVCQLLIEYANDKILVTQKKLIMPSVGDFEQLPYTH
jgi:hypothetical protein